MSTGSSTAAPIDPRAIVSALRRSAVVGRPALLLAPPAVAWCLWGLSFRWIDLARMSDLGLLPALPWTFYAAIAVLTVGFFLALRQARPPEAVLGVHALTLIVIVHATPAIAYGTLRYAWAWKHVGIVDYIQRHGSVDPDIAFLSVYHNWPGFFALSALYTQLAGFTSALSFASWAPLFFNLIFLAALIPLFGALTTDRRRVWLGVWFFFSASWVGQDYFSPQAFAYFLFLVVVVICISWFRLREVPEVGTVRRFIRSPRRAAWFARTVSRADDDAPWYGDAGRGERAVIALLVVLLATVMSFSHQLTPIMLAIALAGLVLSQRVSLRSLPVLVAVIATGWAMLFAVGFLRGNLYWIVDSFGTLTTNANSTLINLSHASRGQQFGAHVDRGLTLGVWLLGVLGFFRLARRGRLDLSAGVLALAPFLLLGLTSYGGEILFRVYFFSLPFVALLATGLFFPGPGPERYGTAAARLLVSAVLLGGFLVAYYGKERQNYFSDNEVRATQVLYGSATPGSLLVSGVNDYPWAYTHYEDYSYLSLADLAPAPRRLAIAKPGDSIAAIARRMAVPCAYVVITSSQKAAVDMTGVMPAGSLGLIERRLSSSPGYRVLLRNGSAVIFGVAVVSSASTCNLSMTEATVVAPSHPESLAARTTSKGGAGRVQQGNTSVRGWALCGADGLLPLGKLGWGQMGSGGVPTPLSGC